MYLYVYIMFIVIICILAAIRTARQTQKVNSFKVVFSLRNKTIYLFFNYFLCTVGLWATSVWFFFILCIQVRPWYKTEIIIKNYIYLVKTHICWWYYIWVIINCFYWNQNVYTAKILIFNNYYEYFNLRQNAYLYLTSKEYNNITMFCTVFFCVQCTQFILYIQTDSLNTHPHVSFYLLFYFLGLYLNAIILSL